MAEKSKLIIGFETNCVPDLNALLDDGKQRIHPRALKLNFAAWQPHTQRAGQQVGTAWCKRGHEATLLRWLLWAASATSLCDLLLVVDLLQTSF